MSRPVRPWDSVILPEGVKERLLEDVEKFISKKGKEWYAKRGKSSRRSSRSIDRQGYLIVAGKLVSLT